MAFPALIPSRLADMVSSPNKKEDQRADPDIEKQEPQEHDIEDPSTTTKDSIPILTKEQRTLGYLHRASQNRKSHVAPLYFVGAGVGKLILGFGASLAMKGGLTPNDEKDLYAGIALACVGLCGCVYAALGFGASITRVNSTFGHIIKAVSISGAVTIGLGYTLSTYFDIKYQKERPENPYLLPNRLTFLILMLGTGLMCISLPNFTAYTELVRGRNAIVPIHLRSKVALGCMSPSLGMLFAGWVTGENAHWPKAFNAVLLTVAVATAVAGASLAWSDDLRRRAAEYERIICLQEEAKSIGLRESREITTPDSALSSSSASAIIINVNEENKDIEKQV